MITLVHLTCDVVGDPERPTALVVAHGASGAIGLGEAQPLPGRSRDTVADCAAAVAAVQGALPLPLSVTTALDAAAELAMAVAPRAPAARFAIETAILDLVARTTGRSLAAVLVEHPADQVATNALVRSAADAVAAVARGHATLKLKLAGDPIADLARARAIRAAIPRDIALRIDGNLTWPAAEVDARLAELAGLAVEYVEEPAPGFASTARSRRATPLALDDSLADADREAWLDDALTSGAIAAVVLKPTLLGLIGCLDIARRATRAGVSAVVTHTFDGAIAMAAACELARAIGAMPGAPIRAHGLAPHLHLPVAVPQLRAPAWARDTGRPGLGLDRREAGWA
jgi:L-alanine-DL-glutamate epimerase-like enolase superfamily enzyme